MKRGELKTVINLALISIIGISLLIFIAVQIFAADKFLDRYACQSSLIAQGTIRPTGNTFFFAQCPNYHVEITNKEITINSGERTEKFDVIDNGRVDDSYRGLKEEYVYQVVSREMEYCWDLFFEGGKDVFERKWFGDDAWSNKQVCFPCDTISFDVPEKKVYYDFLPYLYNHQATKSAEEMTLYEYFNTTSSLNDVDVKTLRTQSGFAENIIFDTSKDYTIIFAKKGGGNPLFGGNYFMWVAESSETNKYCTHWVIPANRRST